MLRLNEVTLMPHYRLYILDRRGDLLGAVDLDCVDDAAAKGRMEEFLNGQPGELWRRVAVSQPNYQSIESSREASLRGESPHIRDCKRQTKSH
jgi:hypothetical protein